MLSLILMLVAMADSRIQYVCYRKRPYPPESQSLLDSFYSFILTDGG